MASESHPLLSTPEAHVKESVPLSSLQLPHASVHLSHDFKKTDIDDAVAHERKTVMESSTHPGHFNGVVHDDIKWLCDLGSHGSVAFSDITTPLVHALKALEGAMKKHTDIVESHLTGLHTELQNTRHEVLDRIGHGIGGMTGGGLDEEAEITILDEEDEEDVQNEAEEELENKDEIDQDAEEADEDLQSRAEKVDERLGDKGEFCRAATPIEAEAVVASKVIEAAQIRLLSRHHRGSAAGWNPRFHSDSAMLMESKRKRSRKPHSGRLRQLRDLRWYCDVELPLREEGGFRLMMDIISIMFLVYDAITVPFVLAFRHENENEEVGWFMMRLFANCFWSLDVLATLVTSVTTLDGEVIGTLAGTALYYVQTWFLFDLMLVAYDWMDWSSVIHSFWEHSESLRLFRILKGGRMFRILIKWRVGRFRHVREFLLQIARNAGLEKQYKFIFPMVSVLLAIFWLSHVGGCFYFVYMRESPTTEGWRVEWNEVLQTDDFISSSPTGYLYASSLYWSLTTMSSGGTPRVPTTAKESLLSFGYVLFGLLFASTLFSSLSAMLVEFYTQSRHQEEILHKLRNLLHQHDVDTHLSIRIVGQLTQRMRQRTRVSIPEVTELSLLSIELRDQLWLEIYKPSLCKHDLFIVLDALNEEIVQALCSSAISWSKVPPGEVLLVTGRNADSAILPKHGHLSYRLRQGVVDTTSSGGENSKTARTITPDDSEWICEATLWIHWQACGNAEAVTHFEMALVHGPQLAKVLRANPHLQTLVSDYALALSEVVWRDRPPLTDIGALVDFHTVVGMLPHQSRVLMSRPALEMLRDDYLVIGGELSGIDRLEAEVNEGKCQVSFDSKGNVYRMVWLVAVQLTRHSGMNREVFVELGEWDGVDFEPTLIWPGTKIRNEETPLSAVNRLMEHAMLCGPDVEGLAWTDRRIETNTDNSRKYTVSTKYIKTIFSGEFDQEERVTGPSVKRKVDVWQQVEMDLTDVVELKGHQVAQKHQIPEIWEVRKGATAGKVFGWVPADTFSRRDHLSDTDIAAIKDKVQAAMQILPAVFDM